MTFDHDANLALQPKDIPSWQKPAPVRAPKRKPSLLARFVFSLS
jgi:hypothetical protein